MNNHTNERRYDMKDAIGFATGLFFGGVAGAVAMLLLAPQSGDETRAQIRQTGIELRDQTAEAVNSATEQLRVKASQISSGVREKADEMQEYAQEMLDGQKERWSPVGDAAQAAAQG